MNNELLQTLVEEDFGYKNEGKWGRAEQHSSLVVNEEAQRWFWNSENMGGDALSYLLLVRKLPKKAALELLKIKNLVASPIVEKRKMDTQPYEKLVDLFWSLGKAKRQYWYKRCLKDSTIDRYRLGHHNGWNTIPLYENGSFLNFQIRRDEPKKAIRYWYDNDSFFPVLMNAELLSLVDTIYITEGTVDSLLLNQEGLPSVAQTGGAGYWNGDWHPLFSKVKSIYYIADNDKAGKFAAYRVANYLGIDRVKVFLFGDSKPDRYDTVNYFQDGGTAEELKELVQGTSKYAFEIGDLNENGTRKNYPAFRKGDRGAKNRQDRFVGLFDYVQR